ncbi:MAG: PDGLE domain-containing protein [Actinomycetota bacterium]
MKKFYATFFLSAVVLAGGVSFYASSHPDGLEKVAEQQGFLDSAKDSAVSGSPLADYGVAGVGSERLSVGLAGVIGVAATALVALVLFQILRRRR